MFHVGESDDFRKAIAEVASLQLKTIVESGIGQLAIEVAKIQAATLSETLKSAGVVGIATEIGRIASEEALHFPTRELLDRIKSFDFSRPVLDALRVPDPKMVDLSFLDEEDEEEGPPVKGFGTRRGDL